MKQNQLTLKQLQDDAIEQLRAIGIEQPEADVKWMLMDCLELSQVDYILKQREVLDNKQLEGFLKVLKRRLNGEPIQYIHGQQDFRGLLFNVDTNVLIPRPETEMLIDLILKEVNQQEGFILDIGTGTGCIPISLLHEQKKWQGVSVDISEGALKIAKQNVKRHDMTERLNLIHSNLFEKLGETYYNRFDIIVSNPPYIPIKDKEVLMPEVRDYEPHLALFGGEDGLDFYRRISIDAKHYLKEGGYLFYEIGIHQSEAVKNLMENNGFKAVTVVNDLTGIPRFVYGIVGK